MDFSFLKKEKIQFLQKHSDDTIHLRKKASFQKAKCGTNAWLKTIGSVRGFKEAKWQQLCSKCVKLYTENPKESVLYDELTKEAISEVRLNNIRKALNVWNATKALQAKESRKKILEQFPDVLSLGMKRKLQRAINPVELVTEQREPREQKEQWSESPPSKRMKMMGNPVFGQHSEPFDKPFDEPMAPGSLFGLVPLGTTRITFDIPSSHVNVTKATEPAVQNTSTDTPVAPETDGVPDISAVQMRTTRE